MKTFTNLAKQSVWESYNIMREAVSCKHIMDVDYIIDKLDKISKFRFVIPDHLYDRIDNFIEGHIRPIITDCEYLTEVYEESEYYEENMSAYSIVHCASMVLEELVDNFAIYYIKPYLEYDEIDFYFEDCTIKTHI